MMDEDLYREMIMYYIVEDDGWRAVQRNDWRTWERGSGKSPASARFKGKSNRDLYFPKNYYPPPFLEF